MSKLTDTQLIILSASQRDDAKTYSIRRIGDDRSPLLDLVSSMKPLLILVPNTRIIP